MDTAGVSSNGIIVTKTSKSLMCTVPSSVDAGFPLADVMDGVFFRSSDGIFLTRCAAVHNKLSILKHTQSD